MPISLITKPSIWKMRGERGKGSANRKYIPSAYVLEHNQGNFPYWETLSTSYIIRILYTGLIVRTGSGIK